MRHNKSGRHFGRNTNQRKALLRGLVSSLFIHERIETTLAKAKEARKMAEKLVTLGLKKDINSRRTALSDLGNRAIITKLFKSIAPRFEGRNGGYLRIVQTRQRVNDRAPMAVLEFVDYEEVREKNRKEAEAQKKTKEKKQEVKKQEGKKQEKK